MGLLVLVACVIAASAASDDKPGAEDFANYCSACHRYDGQDMGEAPPLNDSPWVDGPAETLIKIVLHGVRGRIEIQDEVYDREMPGFGAVLGDERVANLVTFVRGRFGKGGESLRADEVGKIRAKNASRTDYWDADELLRIK